MNLSKRLKYIFGLGPKNKLLKKYEHHAHPIVFEWDWKKTNFNRIALINHLLSRVGGYSAKYLEIGCASNALFDSVPCQCKVGVDPAKGGTHRMTSDDFFKQNKEQFDLIFIDGLHHYDQVHRDAQNAINCLRPGGWIAFHDFLPRSWLEHHVPPVHGYWTGDCWKAGLELAATGGIDFRTLKIDNGVGVMRLTAERPTIVDMTNELAKAEFDYYANALSKLNIVEWDEGMRWIEAASQQR